MLLIGSRAAKYWYPEFREPKDYDFIATPEEYESMSHLLTLVKEKEHKKLCRIGPTQIEIEILTKGRSSETIAKRNKQYTNLLQVYGTSTFGLCPVEVVAPQILLAIKASHVGFSIKWGKNIEDYHFLRIRTTMDLEVYKHRSEESVERNREREERQSNQEFFNNYNIQRKHDHDELHRVVAYGDKPLFLKIKEDPEKAGVSKKLFYTLTYQQQIQLIQEECFVLALERVIIPAEERGEEITEEFQRKAFMIALRKLSTNLRDNPEWIKQFCINHYPRLKDYQRDFYSLYDIAFQVGLL